MSLNQTPSGNRLHIGIFGRQNVGKSSLINALTHQDIAIVSPIKGTTTDPVRKVMELSSLGAVVFIDTPGIDDTTELGIKRMEKSFDLLHKVDLALVVREYQTAPTPSELALEHTLKERLVPTLVVINKSDEGGDASSDDTLFVSAKNGTNIDTLLEQIQRLGREQHPALPLVADLIPKGGVVILVAPIDAGAPKGRLILPQQQVIRDLLDHHALPVVVQPEELPKILALLLTNPDLVVTDSQIFGRVMAMVPPEIPVTSFSILFARYKGILTYSAESIGAISSLEEGDRVLISEGCTHHRQCEDIGTKKIPLLLEKKTGKKLNLSFTSGGTFPTDLSPYGLIIHCGGCTLTGREVLRRMETAKAQNIPMTNYGMFISFAHGTLERSLEPFGLSSISF